MRGVLIIFDNFCFFAFLKGSGRLMSAAVLFCKNAGIPQSTPAQFSIFLIRRFI